jgi:hypothetical protein
MKPPRTSWRNFPEVLIHSNESAVKQHPHYWAAKTGDAIAADNLVRDTLNLGQIDALLGLLNGHQPILVSAHAYEQYGGECHP